jgi:rRNA-processing protein FCF1
MFRFLAIYGDHMVDYVNKMNEISNNRWQYFIDHVTFEELNELLKENES